MSPELQGVGDDLQRAADVVAARGGSLGRPMHLLVTTTSTNDEAKRAAKKGAAHGATWVAEEQTSGRGRQGRTWVSPRGESLLFSVLLRVRCAPGRLPPIALAAGLSVRDVVARAAPRGVVTIKWPNDVLVSGRKVAGVLVEAVTAGGRVDSLVIGVGINVSTRKFPEQLSDRATSIALVAAAPPNRATVLIEVLAGLEADLRLVAEQGLAPLGARLRSHDALLGHRVRSDMAEEGIAAGVDDDGRLLVRREDGMLAQWTSGEVHLLP